MYMIKGFKQHLLMLLAFFLYSSVSFAQDQAPDIYSEAYLLSSCQQNPRTSDTYDCSCFAKKYAQYKVENPSPTMDSAGRQMAYKECRDFTATRDTQYQTCVEHFYRGKQIENKEEKCACYADGYLKRLKAVKRQYASTLRNIEKQVRRECFM